MKLHQTALALAIGVMAANAQAALWSGLFQTSNGSNFRDGVLGMGSVLPMYDFSSAAFFCDTVGGCGDDGLGNPVIPYSAQIHPGAIGNVKPGDFVLTYFQSIVTGGFLNPAPGLRVNPEVPVGSYELTMAALFREQVIGGFLIGSPTSGASATLQVLTGTFGLFYDDNAATFANVSAGTGFTNGIPILSGNINGGFTTYLVSPIGSATGATGINGQVTLARMGGDDPANVSDVAGFMPDAPDAIVATTTIQYGTRAPDLKHQTNGFFDDANGWNRKLVNRNWTVRADGNIDLLRVPEPATLALLGLGLAGLGLSLRRRAA